MQALGSLLFETHQGLRDDYEVSCPELDFLVDRAQVFQGVAGARLVGGGFGGCTLNLVKKDALPEFQKGMAAAYYEHFKKELIPIPVELAEGVGPFS
jgi:galactokinase